MLANNLALFCPFVATEVKLNAKAMNDSFLEERISRQESVQVFHGCCPLFLSTVKRAAGRGEKFGKIYDLARKEA